MSQTNSSLAIKARLALFIIFFATLYDAQSEYRNNHKTQKWEHINAVVVNASATILRPSRGTHYCSVLTTNYSYKGITYQSTLEMHNHCDFIPANSVNDAANWARQTYPNGQKISVLVDPDHPQNTRNLDFLNQPTTSDFILPAFFGIFAFISLFLAF